MPRPTAGGQLTPGSYVVLAVEDSGLGMTAEVQARIFEPFYTTKEVGKGTGLGLSTVYGIVSQHGGGVTVDSAPDHGATFRVYLPADGGAITTDAGASARPVTGGTETILVVEDQDELRRFVREALERHGYRVVDAATPSEALARGEGLGLDLLLTDVVMPEMNGVETARLLRADRPGLPILYMTGYPREALGSGLPDGELIQKPFTSDDLLRRIRALLDEGGTRR
jgi:CheY-like chemotaxis protein